MTDSSVRPDAVLFDFDGVIVDSEPLHWAAFERILAPLGLRIAWDDYLGRYLGFDDRGVFREVFKDAGESLDEAKLPVLIEAKAAAFEALVHEQDPKPYPGVVELIRKLSGAVPLALCSGALRRDVMPILKKLGLERAFDVMVTADDVHVSKPDPSSYVLAVERLRERHIGQAIRAEHAIAIEDTPAGISAARGAGLRVLALLNTYPRHHLGEATRVVESLAGVGLEDLGAMA